MVSRDQAHSCRRVPRAWARQGKIDKLNSSKYFRRSVRRVLSSSTVSSAIISSGLTYLILKYYSKYSDGHWTLCHTPSTYNPVKYVLKSSYVFIRLLTNDVNRESFIGGWIGVFLPCFVVSFSGVTSIYAVFLAWRLFFRAK